MEPFSCFVKIFPNVPDCTWDGERFGSVESHSVRRLLNPAVVTFGGELAGAAAVLATSTPITSARTTTTGKVTHRFNRAIYSPLNATSQDAINGMRLASSMPTVGAPRAWQAS
jgi:hypothetical protein